jgi:hypothetical protein
VCHAGGATDDLFVIKNLPLYLGDSACTWLQHLPRDKIQDSTDLRRVFVGNFQGTCVLTIRALTRHVPRIRFLCLA